MEPITLLRSARMTVAVMFIVILGACDSSSSNKASAPNAGNARKTSAPTADQIELSRYNAAVDAINALGQWGGRSWNAYATQFDVERGPSGKEDRGFVHSVENAATRGPLNALKQSLSRYPTQDMLAQASARYVEASDAMMALTEEASRYYQQENWRDDRFSKGKSLHPKLIAAYRDFLTAHKTLLTEVRRIEEIRDDARLAKYKADSLLMRHDVALGLKQARKIVEWVEEQSAQTRQLPAEHVEELSSQVGAFAQTIESLRKMHAETPDRAKKEFGPMGGSMVSYLENGDRFLKAAKDALRTGREGKPLPNPFAAKIQGMTPYDGLGYTFNALVETSNRLNN